MDYITIDELRVNGAHGHYEHERNVEQEFLVSSDTLTDTIDYDDLRGIVTLVFKGQSHYLIEALADEIAQKILKNTIAKEVSISIKKTAVWPSGIPGISITRTK